MTYLNTKPPGRCFGTRLFPHQTPSHTPHETRRSRPRRGSRLSSEEMQSNKRPGRRQRQLFALDNKVLTTTELAYQPPLFRCSLHLHSHNALDRTMDWRRCRRAPSVGRNFAFKIPSPCKWAMRVPRRSLLRSPPRREPATPGSECAVTVRRHKTTERQIVPSVALSCALFAEAP